MSLPMWIKRVHYRVPGLNAYRGDLVITREVIFYFPRADLSRKWYGEPPDGASYVQGALGAVVGAKPAAEEARQEMRIGGDHLST